MNQGLPPEFRIREINPESKEEILLVATRMRQTLVEVLGQEKGTELYSMEWLVNRVLWHLDPSQTTAKIFLIEGKELKITAHAIARIDHDESKNAYGYFSTVFVEPDSRNKGLATNLLNHVENWLKSMEMPKIIYNTAENHSKLIRLFERHGYQITGRESEMVQLTKLLS